jgi:hypothetical protein
MVAHLLYSRGSYIKMKRLRRLHLSVAFHDWLEHPEKFLLGNDCWH